LQIQGAPEITMMVFEIERILTMHSCLPVAFIAVLAISIIFSSLDLTHDHSINGLADGIETNRWHNYTKRTKHLVKVIDDDGGKRITVSDK
jgi:hypothetical protein